MKKKGFTLVELLAVIAILAILVIIALPNIIGMFNSAKKNSFVNEAKIIYGAATQEYVKDSFGSTGKRIYAKSPNSNCSKQLDVSVKDDLYYYIEIDSAGKVLNYYIYVGSYQYEKEKYDLKKTDIVIDDVYDTSESQEKIIINCDEVIHVANNSESTSTTTTYAMLITGTDLNLRMKQLAGTNTSTNGVDTPDNNITAIKRSLNPPTEENKQTRNLISTSKSEKATYMWYDSGTIYIWSEADKILLNKDSSNTFKFLTALTDITGLADFDTSNVTSMNRLFARDHSLESLEGLEN